MKKQRIASFIALGITFGSIFSSLVIAAPKSKSTPRDTRYQPVVSSYEKLPSAKKRGTLYLSLSGNPKVINPLLAQDGVSAQLLGYLWVPLMDQDGENLAILPGLADSYTISPDHKTYTFTLQPIAKWSDGTPVTSDDVQFTFDTMMNPKTFAAPLRVYWEGTRLQVVDSRTFQFSVAEPKFDTLRSLISFIVINKKQFEKEPDFNQARGIMQPIGNGPYQLKQFQRDQRVELARNPNWWGYSLPNYRNRFNFDQVIFRMTTDPTLCYERLLKGELDVMEFDGPNVEIYQQKVLGIDKDRFGKGPPTETDGKGLWASEFKNKAARGYTYVGWNLHHPLFASKRTRQALAHLADTQALVDKIYYGHSIQTTSPWGSLTQNSDLSLRSAGKMVRLDVKKALQLLKEDGWADTNGDGILDKLIDGKRQDFKFTLKYNSNNPVRGRVAQVLKENFRKAGIDITIRSVEWNAFTDDVSRHDFDAIVLAWSATPFPNAKQVWHSSSYANQGSNFVGYSNPKVDSLIEQSNLEMNEKKRAKIMQEINRLIYEDQPYLFLVEPSAMLAGFNKKLTSSVWAMEYDTSPAVDIYQVR